MDLQYLPEDKKREEDPDIRKMLLETLILVRTTSQIFHLLNHLPVFKKLTYTTVSIVLERSLRSLEDLYLIKNTVIL